MIKELRGNLLDDNADVLVCTTNATGPNGRPAMGKGVALAFVRKWPAIFAPYQADCLSGVLRGGAVRLYDLPEPRDLLSGPLPQRKWAAFCTKHDWRNRSEYRWIEEGLAGLSTLLNQGSHRSVALPPLGCGNGGLDWGRVRPMIDATFAASDIDVRLYLP